MVLIEGGKRGGVRLVWFRDATTATGKLREARRGEKGARRKAEENSLAVWSGGR